MDAVNSCWRRAIPSTAGPAQNGFQARTSSSAPSRAVTAKKRQRGARPGQVTQGDQAGRREQQSGDELE